MRILQTVLLAAACVLGAGRPASAQGAQPPASSNEGWDFAVYPILVWLPVDIDIDVDIPPNGGAGGSGSILESRFDGAFLGGMSATNGTWWIEGYGIWAGFGGQRPERPFLDVDVDLIYGDFKVGRRVAPDLYLTGGLRRIALQYDIRLGDLPTLSRKPGLWDPLVGIGWHRVRRVLEWHATFEGGGFGAGADVDLGATFRLDVKPLRHFGLTAGYSLVYLKVKDTVAGRDVTITPTFNGPVLGIGFYF